MIVLDLKSILKNICVTYPATERLRINSFAAIADRDAFTTSNFNMSFEDYLNGSVWARDWVAEGSDPNCLKIEYPALVVSVINTESAQDGKKTCFKLEIGIIDTKDSCVCEGGELRDDYTFRVELSQVLKNVMLELAKYEEWEKDGKKKWITPQYYEQLTDKTGWVENEKEIKGNLKNISGIRFSKLGMEKEHAAFMSFDICECVGSNLVFDHSQNIVNPIAKCHR
jgi:hypothetical protein